MLPQAEIYKTDGDPCEALIAREDRQGSILSALRKITPVEQRMIYNVGAGTGRLACQLAPEYQ